MGGSFRSCRGRPPFSFAILRPMDYSSVTKMLRRGEDVKQSTALALEKVLLSLEKVLLSLEKVDSLPGCRIRVA